MAGTANLSVLYLPASPSVERLGGIAAVTEHGVLTYTQDSVIFDGESWVSIADHPLGINAADPVALAVRFRLLTQPSLMTSGYPKILIGCGNSYRLAWESGNVLTFRVTDTAASSYAVSIADLPVGDWVSIVVVHRQSSDILELYLNGVSQGTALSSGTLQAPAAGTPVIIGQGVEVEVQYAAVYRNYEVEASLAADIAANGFTLPDSQTLSIDLSSYFTYEFGTIYNLEGITYPVVDMEYLPLIEGPFFALGDIGPLLLSESPYGVFAAPRDPNPTILNWDFSGSALDVQVSSTATDVSAVTRYLEIEVVPSSAYMRIFLGSPGASQTATVSGIVDPAMTAFRWLFEAQKAATTGGETQAYWKDPTFFLSVQRPDEVFPYVLVGADVLDTGAWTAEVGGLGVNGAWFSGGNFASTRVYQEFNLTSLAMDIDLGIMSAQLGAEWRTWSGDADTIALSLSTSADGVAWTEIATTGAQNLPDEEGAFASLSADIPVGHRFIRWYYTGTRATGTELSSYFRNPTLTVTRANTPVETQLRTSTELDPDLWPVEQGGPINVINGFLSPGIAAVTRTYQTTGPVPLLFVQAMQAPGTVTTARASGVFAGAIDNTDVGSLEIRGYRAGAWLLVAKGPALDADPSTGNQWVGFPPLMVPTESRSAVGLRLPAGLEIYGKRFRYALEATDGSHIWQSSWLTLPEKGGGGVIDPPPEPPYPAEIIVNIFAPEQDAPYAVGRLPDILGEGYDYSWSRVRAGVGEEVGPPVEDAERGPLVLAYLRHGRFRYRLTVQVAGETHRQDFILFISPDRTQEADRG